MEEGLKLLIPFAFGPNYLKYCGPIGTYRLLYSCWKSGRYGKKVKRIFTKFEALYPYLCLIAECNELDPFDYEVIEAYWIGNKLVENVSVQELKENLYREFSPSLTREIISKKLEKIKGDIPPTHLFHVLYFTSITGKLKITLSSQEKCKVSLGEVKKMGGEKAKVEFNGLTIKNKKYSFKKRRKEIWIEFPVKGEKISFISDINRGELIFFHWDLAVLKPDRKQVKNYLKYSKIVLEKVNKFI